MCGVWQRDNVWFGSSCKNYHWPFSKPGSEHVELQAHCSSRLVEWNTGVAGNRAGVFRSSTCTPIYLSSKEEGRSRWHKREQSDLSSQRDSLGPYAGCPTLLFSSTKPKFLYPTQAAQKPTDCPQVAVRLERQLPYPEVKKIIAGQKDPEGCLNLKPVSWPFCSSHSLEKKKKRNWEVETKLKSISWVITQFLCLYLNQL